MSIVIESCICGASSFEVNEKNLSDGGGCIECENCGMILYPVEEESKVIDNIYDLASYFQINPEQNAFTLETAIEERMKEFSDVVNIAFATRSVAVSFGRRVYRLFYPFGQEEMDAICDMLEDVYCSLDEDEEDYDFDNEYELY